MIRLLRIAAREYGAYVRTAGFWLSMLMMPAIVGAFMLSLIRGIEAFESPLFFGTPAGITVITTEIYNAINHRATPDYQYATALSICILALMFLLVVW